MQHIVTSLVDDLDGSEAAGTVTFALDGMAYEVDLSIANNKALREILAPFIEAARKTGRPAKRRGDRASADRNKAIRQWGKDHGFEVPEKGRIPSRVVHEYESANPAA